MTVAAAAPPAPERTPLWRHPWIVHTARVAIGLVFLAAALGKIGDPAGFSLQVHNYRMAPVWSENLLALLLPWVELVAGLALVLGVRARSGAVVALALMIAFTIAVGSAWSRGLDFECGCFGKVGAGRIGATKFVENLVLIALAGLAAERLPDAPRAAAVSAGSA